MPVQGGSPAGAGSAREEKMAILSYSGLRFWVICWLSNHDYCDFKHAQDELHMNTAAQGSSHSQGDPGGVQTDFWDLPGLTPSEAGDHKQGQGQGQGATASQGLL